MRRVVLALPVGARPTSMHGEGGGSGWIVDGQLEVIERLRVAMNEHDLDAMVACFDDAYRSEQPAHPVRGFGGAAQVRQNWSALFTAIPDFRADLLRSAISGDEAWAEWRWIGTRTGGSRFEERGVSVFGVRGDRIVWARLYLEEVEEGGDDIDEAVRRMAGGPSGAG
jgi:hypothetical protein